MCEGTDALEGLSSSDCAASLEDEAKFAMMDDVNGADNESDHLAAAFSHCAAIKVSLASFESNAFKVIAGSFWTPQMLLYVTSLYLL